jgi:hypothetical protein
MPRPREHYKNKIGSRSSSRVLNEAANLRALLPPMLGAECVREVVVADGGSTEDSVAAALLRRRGF